MNERNEELTKQAKERFAGLLEWGRENGVLFGQFEVPVVFGAGLTGAAAAEDLAPFQAILALPMRLMITPEKVHENPELKPLVDRIMSYAQEGKDEMDFKMLVLFFLYERLQG
jgi:hypothetical protein